MYYVNSNLYNYHYAKNQNHFLKRGARGMINKNINEFCEFLEKESSPEREEFLKSINELLNALDMFIDAINKEYFTNERKD